MPFAVYIMIKNVKKNDAKQHGSYYFMQQQRKCARNKKYCYGT